MDYQPLPLTHSHGDHTLKQAWRDEMHAIYQHFGAFGQFIGWEGIRIKRKPEQVIFGKPYPAREVYPGNEDFGKNAISIGAQYDLDYAINRTKERLPDAQRRAKTLEPSGFDRPVVSGQPKA